MVQPVEDADPEPDILPVIGFGHPLLDISTHVTLHFLEKYHIQAGQTMLAEPDQLGVYEEISQHKDVEYVPGGATMNAIRVCRWLLGGSCAFSGTLGDDEFGAILERALRRTGVRPLFERSEIEPTGTCACLIVGKERSLIAHLGAALKFTLRHMDSRPVAQAISSSHIFYSAGFFLNTISSPEAPMRLAKFCAEHNRIWAMNLSAPYLCHAFRETWEMIMPYIDYLFGNKNDVMAYAAAQGWETDGDHIDVAVRLARLPKVNRKRGRVVVATHGGDPTAVATEDGVTEYETPPLCPEDIVDLNGAGDAFVGGFLSQLAQKRPMRDCIRGGQYAAQVIIRNHGCTFPEQHGFSLDDPDLFASVP
eukprot:TRINITY_DN9916_c0_g1_i1.p1 TRINITY_DN9916_c0_g1~~TRINITY_DN9916_c0_g1_i1.p1  ORF type:complete len:392 (+),score=105.96 TRINITY_DN9916_c0_g1_i1:86-1177(+)